MLRTKRDKHTNTSIYILSNCMCPPRLYSYYEVTSILQLYDVTNIKYVDSYIITALSACTGHH